MKSHRTMYDELVRSHLKANNRIKNVFDDGSDGVFIPTEDIQNKYCKDGFVYSTKWGTIPAMKKHLVTWLYSDMIIDKDGGYIFRASLYW